MLIKSFSVGHLDTNCYIVTNEESLECVVVDPGADGNTIMDYIEENHLSCRAILLTHGHFDHTGAVAQIAEETGAVVYMNKRDDVRTIGTGAHITFALPDDGIYYDDGDTVSAAGMEFDIIATPGHTPGSVTIRCADALFTGDTLFRGTCGRTDLPGGDMVQELDSLRRICELEGDYEIYPGHMEFTTLERERCFNHYCRAAMSQG